VEKHCEFDLLQLNLNKNLTLIVFISRCLIYFS